jgi:lipopolysaccharide export system permease protein
MKVLERYIGLAVITGTIAALMVLLTLLGFLTLMDELQDVGKGRYEMADAFGFMLLVLPRYAYEVFPIAALLGSLIGLGGLAAHSELIAIRAAGVSFGRIVLAVMKAGLMMILVVVLVGEFLAPETEQYAQRMRSEKQAEQITLKTRYGFWARDGSAYINIRTILPGAQLADIYIYEFGPDGALQASTHAASAGYQGDHWQLEDIRQSRFEGDGVEVVELEQATWDSLLDPELLSAVVVDPNILPVWGLYHYISFMRANGQEVLNYEVAFWSKVVAPLVTLVMLFLSAPFVFGSLRSVGIGQRLFMGSLMGSGFYLLNRAFSFMAVAYDLNPLFAAAFPGLAFLGLAILFSQRVR